MEIFNNQWIDIHSHKPAGQGIEIVNVSPEDLDFRLSPGHYSVGIHPWFIDPQRVGVLFEKIRSIANSPSIYAIGETGIDKLGKVPLQVQIELFRMHAELAEQVQKPLIIHCVKAFQELASIKRELGPTVSWIVHGFNNNLHQADLLLNHEIFLSFGQALLNQHSNAWKILPEIPDEAFLFETDDAGIPVSEVYKAASNRLGLELNPLKELIYLNFINCFRI